jgi:hypothetical protein
MVHPNNSSLPVCLELETIHPEILSENGIMLFAHSEKCATYALVAGIFLKSLSDMKGFVKAL